MKTLKVLVIVSLFICFIGTSVGNCSEEYVVCQYCSGQDYDSIEDALTVADDGDTIVIVAESDGLQPPSIIDYNEHLLVNKEVTITCDAPHATLGYPVISGDFSSFDEIIKVTHDDVEISNLEVVGPTLETLLSSYPMDDIDTDVGIRIEAANCLIDNCRVTHCYTGISIDSSSGVSRTGNRISDCTIGDRFIYSNPNHTEEYWINSQLLDHPGNGFGIVIQGPTWTQPSESYINIAPNEITDCMIRSNRYYGVVLTNGSRAKIEHSIIAWNGDLSCTLATQSTDVIPDKTGGLLSLFTATDIANNTNKLQSPLILSNNIYGNLGYQISVVTGSDSPDRIYNSPVLMSNTVGTQADMGDPSGSTSINMDNYLISCGPKPNLTPTPIPPSGSYTPLPPGEFGYDHHGSGPIMAWNCLSNPAGREYWNTYHPMQEDTLAHTPKPTDTPTNTPLGPTNTPVRTHTPSARPGIVASPTGFVTWTPTPTMPPSIPTPTPPYHYYRFGNGGWSVKNVIGESKFIGWDTQVTPPVFDWRVQDVSTTNPTPPPAGTPTQLPDVSACLNTGGLTLNPGVSQDDMLPDENRIDMGYHTKGGVPPVKNLELKWITPSITVSAGWSKPEYYYDGSLLQFSDVGGYKVYRGQKGTITQYVVVGNPTDVAADSTVKEIEIGLMYRVDAIGVSIYDVRGLESDISWEPLPKQ